MKRSLVIILLVIVSAFCVLSGFAGKTGFCLSASGEKAVDYALEMTVAELKNSGVCKPRVINFNDEMDLFGDVFHVKIEKDITFNMMWYCSDRMAFVFMNEKVVSMIIIGMTEKWTGIPSLSKGINYVLYSLGNDGLIVTQEEKHYIYNYPEKGLAFFDDKKDDVVDLCIVYEPQK